jgi:hypothetical protein
MVLGLHKNCRERLIEKITELLPQVKVQNRMFIERKSAVVLILAESILPQSGPINGRLKQYISETPIFDFAYETLSQELSENQQYDSESPSLPLNEIEGYNEPNVTANRLIQDFETLPWEYCLSIKLENDFGELFAKTIKDYSICDSIKLIVPGDNFSEEFPLSSGIEARDRNLSGGPLLTGLAGLLAGLFLLQWDQLSTYLQIKVIGFIGKYGETTPIVEAISLLKAFCGIGIALRLFKINYTYRPTPTKAKFFIHRRIGDEWVIERLYDLEAGLSDTFHDLVFHDLDGNLKSEEDKALWIDGRIGEINCVFTHREKAQRIIRASQWLFDSYCGKNELLSFVQTTVVMEILLGEKAISDVMGLGDLLRNRCAYLIGDSHKQREDILKDFKEIYDVRSKIVHRGKAKLNMNERFLFSKLQWMCRRVIQKEIELLQKDIKKSK